MSPAGGPIFFAILLLVAIPAMFYAWLVILGYLLAISAKTVLKERPTLRRAMLIELAAWFLSVLTGVGVALLISILGGNPNSTDPMTQIVASMTGMLTRAGVVAKMLECTLWKAILVVILQGLYCFAIAIVVMLVVFAAISIATYP
ncbi:MAG: hypothetical protein JJU33_12945 [Phycisphaerales bacterium]|nr:hypothetical protein [Phycisphaerales bacterium]